MSRSTIFTRPFGLAAAERAIKTFAQAWAALLLADGTGLLDTDWQASLSVAGMSAVISLLTSVGSGTVGEKGPSLTTESTALADVDDEYAGEHRRPD